MWCQGYTTYVRLVAKTKLPLTYMAAQVHEVLKTLHSLQIMRYSHVPGSHSKCAVNLFFTVLCSPDVIHIILWYLKVSNLREFSPTLEEVGS